MLTLLHPCADTFHKPGFKMHARILHHLFLVAASDVIKVLTPTPTLTLTQTLTLSLPPPHADSSVTWQSIQCPHTCHKFVEHEFMSVSPAVVCVACRRMLP